MLIQIVLQGLGGMAGLIGQGRGAPNLMGNIRPRIADVPVHLPHDANVLVAVEQRVLLFLVGPIPASAGVGRLVRLQAGIGEDDY